VCTPSTSDWFGLYLPGAPDWPFLSGRFTTGGASGSLPLAVPATLGAGTYELRFFVNNKRVAVSNSFAIAACPASGLSASPTSVYAGASVTASWSSVCTPTGSDWIGLYPPGAADTAYLAARNTTGAASGSVAIAIPATLAPGTYQLRLFSNGGYTRLALASLTVAACPPGSLSASPASIVAGGSVTAAWSGLCLPGGSDWIGLYRPGAADTSYLAARYTTGAASGSVPFAIPASLAPGTYELRLFPNGGYTRAATSNEVVVSSP
jgi:hypothetical protein